jgi:hypothetical protein
LKPPVTVEEALQWLELQAIVTWGVNPSSELTASLQPIAQAMAAVSSAEVPDDIEPLLI